MLNLFNSLYTCLLPPSPPPLFSPLPSPSYSVLSLPLPFPTSGWVLSSFFYGYILTQLPGGFIATRLSGKHVFGLGVLLTALLTLLTPIAAVTDIRLLIALRVLEGICEVQFSAISVSVHGIVYSWYVCNVQFCYFPLCINAYI